MARGATRLATAIILSTLVLPDGASAQSAGEIVDRALERHEQRMEGVENYTVIQRMDEGLGAVGTRVSTYFERTMENGRPVYVVREAGMGGATSDAPMQAGPMGDAGSMMAKVGDRVSLTGTESVDGNLCWVLYVDDASALDWENAVGDGTFSARTLTMVLDQEEYVLRRISVEGDIERDGRPQPVSMVSTLTDYRRVEGMLHPFRTEVEVSGIASGSMSPEEREELMRNLAEAREQLEQMPEAQRAMAESMMAGQLERMEQMLAEDELEITMVVDELRVNEGPPAGGR